MRDESTRDQSAAEPSNTKNKKKSTKKQTAFKPSKPLVHMTINELKALPEDYGWGFYIKEDGVVIFVFSDGSSAKYQDAGEGATELFGSWAQKACVRKDGDVWLNSGTEKISDSPVYGNPFNGKLFTPGVGYSPYTFN